MNRPRAKVEEDELESRNGESIALGPSLETVSNSAKNLQPDPTEIALREVASLLQVQVLNATSPTEAGFTPSLAAVWVNALWFLSLSLSVSASLVAMLAKTVVLFVRIWLDRSAARSGPLEGSVDSMDWNETDPYGLGLQLSSRQRHNPANSNVAAFGAACMGIWREFWTQVEWIWPKAPITTSYNLLKKYSEGELTLHSSAVVALVKRIALEAARWFDLRYAHDRGHVVMVLVKLVSRTSLHFL
ncbi:transmembrane protein [Rhizoctonia solani]|uniref:Transmembrane protein n=1 Tax=Rhizoctonia solani TaxID=456999 RepID=A0A8H8NTD7_9AGAM|nr:uncharacterized protein RhiXN_03020 [Rhizoctonia solani]QRW18096.1 transmembrane protein [Rhizoctonia solani]